MSFTSSFADKVKLSRAADIYLVKGINKDFPCWHYVNVDKAKTVIFEKMVREKQFMDYSEYGRVIISGWGESPPYKVDDMIKDQGINLVIDEVLTEPDTFFVHNITDAGREYYNFVGVPKFLIEDFKHVCTIGQFDLLEYGFVIKAGWGRPTEEVVDYMVKEHNFDRELIKEYLAEA